VRVAFDTRPSTDAHGLGRYSRCMLRALHETAASGDEILETQHPSAFARSRGADVFHAPWMSGALLHSPCPMVVTVHGLAPLKRRSEHLRGGLRMRLRHLAVQRAERVLGLDEGRIVVIPEAADESMYPRAADEVAAARGRFGLPDRYLVWVGGLEHPDPGRHVAELASAPRELPLVLVGRARAWAHELSDVILTGLVGDEDLAAIYTGAHALVLPSEGEGFGLPAVEALACGTPVVAFSSPALREVLGERATFVEPGDFDGLMRAAHAAVRPAPEPPRWSWQDAASASWNVYARALDGVASRPASPRASRRGLRGPVPPQPGAIDGLEPQ
jgi:glycosyltransferase involved in cell wall biosynthesis